MPHRIEIALKADLFDAYGEGIRQKAKNYFGISLKAVRIINIITIDADLSAAQCRLVKDEAFTNPVTQIASLKSLNIDFDWIIWIGYRPGVKDNPGSTAVEAIEDILRVKFAPDEAVYTSKRYCLKGADLTFTEVEQIASKLLANNIIQQWNIIAASDWNPAEGIGFIIPRVLLDHIPTVATVAVDSNETLQKISDQRNLALNPDDIPTIRAYFTDPRVIKERAVKGLAEPTDIELEYISQARSDHCNHNTFQGRFSYFDSDGGQVQVIDSLFKTCIESPTLALKKKKTG